MTKESREQIMEKLKKLMNHYEGANAVGSEEEANTAAAMLQRMLVKYNISAHELEESRDDDLRQREVVEESMSCYTRKSVGGTWEYDLMNVICRWNLCRCFYLGKKKFKRMVILGERQNVEFVKWMHEMLAQRFVKFSKEKYRDFVINHEMEWIREGCIRLDTYQRRYLLGCCDGLYNKFAEMDRAGRAEDATFDGQCTALILRNDANLDEYQQKKWGKVGQVGAGQNIRKGASYRQGHEDGYATDINKPISAQGSKTKMIGR